MVGTKSFLKDTGKSAEMNKKILILKTHFKNIFNNLNTMSINPRERSETFAYLNYHYFAITPTIIVISYFSQHYIILNT